MVCLVCDGVVLVYCIDLVKHDLCNNFSVCEVWSSGECRCALLSLLYLLIEGNGSCFLITRGDDVNKSRIWYSILEEIDEASYHHHNCRL